MSRWRRIDPQIVIVMGVVLLITVLVVHYLDHRREVGDERQQGNVIRQDALNAQQAALNAQQQREDAKFDASRRAQCYVFHYLFRHVNAPSNPDIRRALAEALTVARCEKVIYAATHPMPPASPTVAVSPMPGPTVTVTRTARPPAQPRATVTIPPPCRGIHVNGGCVPTHVPTLMPSLGLVSS